MRADVFDFKAALMRQLADAESALALDDSVQATHQCRVALKRARALARIAIHGAPGLCAVFNDAARDLMADLSAARDLAALAAFAQELSAGEKRKSKRALRRVAAALDAARSALPPINRANALARLKDLRALAQVWPEPSPRQIAKGVKRLVRRARRAFEFAYGHDQPTLRHKWRKREKERRYAAEFAAHVWPKSSRPRPLVGRALSRALGQEREALLLMERIEASPVLAGGERRAARALQALHAAHQRLADEADRLGRKLHRRRA